MNTPIDYLLIGNITKDILPDGAMLGGTVSYAAVMAHRLHRRVGIVSRVGKDAPPLDVLDSIALHRVSAAQTTTFQNVYENGVRHQKWTADGGMLTPDDIPAAWQTAPIVHLAPIAQEIHPSMCAAFPKSLVGVTVQGWLRGRDAANRVQYRPHPELMAWIRHADIVVLSLNDFFGDRAAMMKLLATVPLGVETLGAEGCAVYHRGGRTVVPVIAESETDPTGAGDIFATAFFIRYAETEDWLDAAQFANACASLSVTRMGVSGVPSLEEIHARQRELYGK